MHKIDLSNFNLRTDLIIEENIENIKPKKYSYQDITVEDIVLDNNNELKNLIWEVLSPLESNMFVTVKEIDFIIEKMCQLIGNGINNVIHHID